jgi:DNA repair protein RadD
LAHEWWKERSWDEVPELTADAMTQVNELKQPTHIRVWINRQHPEVKAYDFTGSAFGQGA